LFFILPSAAFGEGSVFLVPLPLLAAFLVFVRLLVNFFSGLFTFILFFFGGVFLFLFDVLGAPLAFLPSFPFHFGSSVGASRSRGGLLFLSSFCLFAPL